MTRPIVYLAGFDVFRRDAVNQGEYLRETCQEFGLIGVFPLDATLDPELDSPERARRIFEHNLQAIRACDAVMANLDDFRGAGEPDAGTAFEVGFAHALGKPVFAYSTHTGPLIERVPGTSDDQGHAFCERGFLIEDFGLPFNLMLACSSTLIKGGPLECARALAQHFRHGFH